MSQPKVSKSSIFAIIAGSLFEDADKSKNYVCQMPVTGEYVVWTGLQWQGGGQVCRVLQRTKDLESETVRTNWVKTK